MSTTTFIIAMIFTIISMGFTIASSDNALCLIPATFFFVVACFTVKKGTEGPRPTLQDVMEKRARVVEIQTISEGDTVRTYQMMWN